MKKFFTKYIVFPGEPTNMCLTERGIETYTEYHWRDWAYFDSHAPDKQNIHAVELCMCSRDIQAGDVYYTDNFNKYIAPSQIDEEYLKYNNERFKIIGIVSHDAKWIKEGEEFDEEDIKTVKICRDTSQPPYSTLCFHCGSTEDCMNNEGDKVLVKCNCCGDFK